MDKSRPRDWMFSRALNMLAEADRLHKQMFRPCGDAQPGAWEPPVDVLETPDAVLVIAALPGVDAAKICATIENGTLLLAGERVLPPELRTAVIHRLELPQGRFERRIPLPPGRYETNVRHLVSDGCLVVRLTKVAK